LTTLIMIGAGGHARVLIELCQALGSFELLGVVAQSGPPRLMGLPLLGDESHLEALRRQGVQAACVAVGDNAARARIGARLQALGFALPALVHPAAFVAPSAVVSPGAVVMARAVLGTQARAERLTILNTGAIADHDVVLGEASHVAPGAVLAGHASLGAGALLGAGAAVRPGIVVGAGAVIGAGSAVVADIAPGATMAGVPARPLT
jgi:UDP-perosamine 4-acetyltransferase